MKKPATTSASRRCTEKPSTSSTKAEPEMAATLSTPKMAPTIATMAARMTR